MTITVVPASGGAKFNSAPEHEDFNPTDSSMLSGLLHTFGMGALANVLEVMEYAGEASSRKNIQHGNGLNIKRNAKPEFWLK